MRVATAKRSKFEAFDRLACSGETPIRPERVVAALNQVLPDDAVLVADPGTPCPYLSAYYRVNRPGRHFISNRAHGALGYALPAAMGAQMGRPDATVVSVMGDGSFGFAAGEFETIMRLDLPITFIVFSNAVYGWIKAGQKAGIRRALLLGGLHADRSRAGCRAYGLKTWRVEDPDELSAALKDAVAHDGPALVDVIAQPLHEAHAPVSEWIA